VYRCKDDLYVALSASTQKMAERTLRAVGRPELIDDPRYRTNAERVKHAAELDAIIGAFVAQRTQAENVAFFEQAEVTIGPIYDVRQILEDPHFIEREIIADYPDDEMDAFPMHHVVPRLLGTPGSIRSPAPKAGAAQPRAAGLESRSLRGIAGERHRLRMKDNLPIWRSLMYVPVNVEKYVDKAHTRGADCLQLDLEDSVPVVGEGRRAQAGSGGGEAGAPRRRRRGGAHQQPARARRARPGLLHRRERGRHRRDQGAEAPSISAASMSSFQNWKPKEACGSATRG
jgi:hypothetical protein